MKMRSVDLETRQIEDAMILCMGTWAGGHGRFHLRRRARRINHGMRALGFLKDSLFKKPILSRQL